jgi:glycosidase
MRSLFYPLAALLALLLSLCCHPSDNPTQDASQTAAGESGITYQLLVYSFADGIKNDKIGDIQGIIDHLDYIEALGAGAIWLSPIHPCSSYHGYDVTTSSASLSAGHIGYDEVNAKFGNDGDIYLLCQAAHKKGIKIYLDYVLNHTSSQHPWFLNAKQSASSPYRDYYIFSDSPQADISAGKIPMIAREGAGGYDAGQWYATGVGSTKYHSHFWTGSFADINYGAAAKCEQSAPFKAVCKAAEHWIDLGVDGFRLDAVRHIYHHATTDENPVFLKKFYDYCNDYYKTSGHAGEFYMVGENWTNAGEVAPYYKGLPALFDFQFYWDLRDAIKAGVGSAFPKKVLDNQALYASKADAWKPIDATKLSNHDENRTGSDLDKDVAKMKLAACVLLTSSGEPYVYQGEELGYWGIKDNRGDEYVRTPINWKADGSQQAAASLGSKVEREVLDAAHSVENQEKDENSILNVYRRFGAARKQYASLGKDGAMSQHPVFGSSSKIPAVAAWYRSSGSEKMLVLHNFSATTVSLTLDQDNISELVVSNGSVLAMPKFNAVELGAYASAVFKQ